MTPFSFKRVSCSIWNSRRETMSILKNFRHVCQNAIGVSTSLICLLASANAHAEGWMKFGWKNENVEGNTLEKAAMMIDIGNQQQLQLDTGSPSSYLYAPAYQFEGEELHSFVTNSGLKISETFKLHDTAKSSDEVVGTLGASYFKEHILIIDFPNQRLMKTASLPEEFARANIEYIEGNVTDSMHIVTSVQVGEHTLAPVVFDTGSSMFKLVLNKESWQDLVSEKHAASPPQTMKVPAWGRSITLYGAESVSPICLGKICVKGDIFYSDDPNLDFSKAGLAGLMGNAILEDGYVLILDYANKRVGTIKSNGN